MTRRALHVIYRDMNEATSSTRYHSPLRTRQKEQTRNLILDAVDTILRRANAADVTVADVAREAQVTERTVYRHFPTREDLLNASWRRALRAFIRGQTQQVHTVDEITGLTRAAFKNFDENQGIVRAIIGSAEGAAVRRGPGQQRFDMLVRAYGGILKGAPEELIQA